MIAIVSSYGALGCQVIDQLLAQGLPAEQIAAVGSCLNKLPDCDAMKGIHKRGINYDDRQSLEAAFADIDTLVLIPGSASVNSCIQQHSQTVAAAKAAGVRRVLLLSLSCARPESQVLITPFLLYAESVIRGSGMEWLILRRGLYIEPFAEWAPQLNEWGELYFPGRGGHCSYVSQRDIARATAAAARKDSLSGEVLELTGPAAITISEVVSALSRITGNRIRLSETTDNDFLQRCVREGKSQSEAERLLSFCHGVDDGDFARATDHIERLTGEPPESAFIALKRLLNEKSQ